MNNNIYLDAEDGAVFDTIEEALMSCCHLCGTPLEWELKLAWNATAEKSFITGYDRCCGYEFRIEPVLSSQTDLEGYRIRLLKLA
jgi:hypothetical protein|nr:MAG TPA: Rad50 zinc hook motif [Caudoviricetes sp.]